MRIISSTTLPGTRVVTVETLTLSLSFPLASRRATTRSSTTPRCVLTLHPKVDLGTAERSLTDDIPLLSFSRGVFTSSPPRFAGQHSRRVNDRSGEACTVLRRGAGLEVGRVCQNDGTGCLCYESAKNRAGERLATCQSLALSTQRMLLFLAFNQLRKKSSRCTGLRWPPHLRRRPDEALLLDVARLAQELELAPRDCKETL